jgi:hypothetical protein
MPGRSRTRRALYLAGAMAIYAWRSHARSRRVDAADGHDGAGITDLPPDAEDAQQSALPPRGTRRGNVHA